MIRIDEIYENTFLHWVKNNLPTTVLYYHEPFGYSDPDSILCRSFVPAKEEENFIYFFDQEPLIPDYHQATFNSIDNRNIDWSMVEWPDSKNIYREKPGILVTSETASNNIDYICKQRNLRPFYYFFHGWAALDWYRGYNRTFLIKPWQERVITKTFLAPNRIVAGERQHRLEMLYWIFKLGMTNNHISCPDICPAENIAILDAVQPLKNKYPDIETVFAKQPLPMNFAGETDHPMHSCWLSLFDQSAESLLYLVTETVATGRRHHLTEKTFKPIALGMPFVIVGTQGSLRYLRSYGFKTFGSLWDESYDDEPDDSKRIEKIANTLKLLENLEEDKQIIFESAQDIIEYNWNHFYNGGFEAILWKELQEMLNDIEFDSRSNSPR